MFKRSDFLSVSHLCRFAGLVGHVSVGRGWVGIPVCRKVEVDSRKTKCSSDFCPTVGWSRSVMSVTEAGVGIHGRRKVEVSINEVSDNEAFLYYET